jgi:PhnB protein
MTVKAIREGFHTVTPYLMVEEPTKLIDFVKEVFGATELLRGIGSAGGLHAEVRIGDSMVMIGGGNTGVMPAAIYLYIDDVDAAYQRALSAGALSLSEPEDQPYGDRNAGVKDVFGNIWYIATHIL